jgi:hypothetical protein
MTSHSKTLCHAAALTFASLLTISMTGHAATSGLAPGPVSLKSVGPMTFAPSGVLLVGDPIAATVYAIDTEDSGTAATDLRIDDIAKVISDSLHLTDVQIGELAVNPETGHTFLSISSREGVRLIKVSGDGSIAEVNLDKAIHAKKALPNPPEDRETEWRGRKRNPRSESITDIAYFDGKVMVTGKSTDKVPSRVIEMPFPFAENTVMTGVEIFHAAHGRVETPAIQTFLPMTIDGKPTLLAGFTCTPLVRFPVDALDGAEKVRGTTVAELGNRNKPLDMVVYEKNGKTTILMSNTARGVMKITTDGIEERDGLTEKVSGGGTAGQPFETIESLSGIRQMDKLNDEHAVALIETDGKLSLQTIELP